MRSKMKNSRAVRISVIVLVSVLVLAAVVAASSEGIKLALQALSSDNEFYDVNPTLELASIQGNAEAMKSEDLYTHESSLAQGEGKYAITTNSYVEWFDQDDVAFAYKYYGVKTNKKDWIEITCQVDYPSNTDGTTFNPAGLHHPSTGVEFRSGLGNDASFIYLHMRDTGTMCLVYRDPNYASSLYKCSAQENLLNLTAEDYPVSMKLSMSGTTFLASYKVNGSDTWVECTAVKLNGFTSGVYAGLCAHSGGERAMMQATFSNLIIQGQASMTSTGSEGSATTAPEVVDEDAVINDKTILLRETFTDGGLNNGTDLYNNPIWSNFVTLNGVSIKNVEGNRMLYSEYGNGMDLIGNETWTDYTASMDFMYDSEQVSADDSNIVGLTVRSVANLFYGYQNYVVTVEGGTTVKIYKSFFQAATDISNASVRASVELPESILMDERIHSLRVDCFDNTLTVYLDGVELIYYMDDGAIDWGLGAGQNHVNSVGGIGVLFDSTFAYVDNIVVKKLDDPIGGDYDNAIGGNWDVPVPYYINKFQ